ncbi:MAG TPA: hypothetical protein VGE07_15510 [Herpetosiphonaceae bacterium]
MAWLPADAEIPAGYVTADYRLRMLSTDDVDLDYEAVIASREQLLLKSLGDWPAPGFTIEENYADLDRHQREHGERTSFTYTIMNLEGTQCLGCVYVNPLAGLLAKVAAHRQVAGGERDPAADATVYYWVRPERIAEGMDRLLIAHLVAWFALEWPFENVVFQVFEGERQQIETLESQDLEIIYELESRRTNQRLLLYGEAEG